MNAVNFAFPLTAELMTTVRLTTGGICSLAGLCLDDSEDCKVCVTESLHLLRHRGYARAELAFRWDEGLCIAVTGEGERGKETEASEDEISAALLSALAEDVIVEKRDGAVCKISFRFGLQA
jgi:hypothetical protein